MQGNEANRWYGNNGGNAGRYHEGVRVCYASADEKPCPAEVKTFVEICRSLRADAVVLELADQTIVIAMNIYDGTYAVAFCDPEAHFPSVARGLQVRLYSEPCGESSTAFLPAATVRSAMGGWECQIALVFGRHYAAKLMMGASGEKAPGEMSPDDLERIRLRLSSAIGGCLHLEKVDK
jgi:hypothetical protein